MTRALEDELSSSWRAASAWVERALERGDGLVRHGPRTAGGGLVQQGWRDTSDPLQAYGGGILDADGRVPEPPLADADTQAVTVAALRATARLSGDSRWLSLAERTAERIADAFTPDTMAVDAKRPARFGRRVAARLAAVGGRAAADSERAAYAERLCQPDVLTDFGLRTLSSGHPQIRRRAPTTAAPCGRSTRGSAGVDFGPSGATARGRTRARRGAGCARSPRRRPGALRGHLAVARSRSRSPTGCRRGRSARGSRSSSAGTAGSALDRAGREPGHDPLLEDHHEHDQRDR